MQECAATSLVARENLRLDSDHRDDNWGDNGGDIDNALQKVLLKC